MQGKSYLRKALVGLFCCFPFSANASVAYFNDFQNSVGPGWSSSGNPIGISTAPNKDFERKFLGEFNKDAVSLMLTGLPEHELTTVSFSLYLIRSWDGESKRIINNDALGPDKWTLNVSGGPTLLDTTFSNGNPDGQAYSPGPKTLSCNQGYNAVFPENVYNPMTGAAECYSLGYVFNDGILNTSESMDSVYNFSFTFPHKSSDVTFIFGAEGLQSIADESWGLDNVKVVTVIPVPAAVWLFVSGLVGLTGVAAASRTRRGVINS